MKPETIKKLLKKEIAKCKKAYKKPNNIVVNYRCYFEGREALAKELLKKLKDK